MNRGDAVWPAVGSEWRHWYGESGSPYLGPGQASKHRTLHTQSGSRPPGTHVADASRDQTPDEAWWGETGTDAPCMHRHHTPLPTGHESCRARLDDSEAGPRGAPRDEPWSKVRGSHGAGGFICFTERGGEGIERLANLIRLPVA